MTPLEQLKQCEEELEIPQTTLENLTPIQFAAKHGEDEFITTQLQVKDPVTRQRILEQKTQLGGFTALHYAAFFGHIACVKSLLTFGASLHCVTTLQMKPIQLALLSNKNDKDKKVRLFEQLNTDLTILRHRNINGDTLAHLAAEFNLPEILSVIKTEAADSLNIQNQQGLTPLLVGLLNNSTRAVSLLLDTPSIDIKDSKGRNALHYATLYASASFLANIIPYVSSNPRDGDGLCALDYAAKNKDAKKMKLLETSHPASSALNRHSASDL